MQDFVYIQLLKKQIQLDLRVCFLHDQSRADAGLGLGAAEVEKDREYRAPGDLEHPPPGPYLFGIGRKYLSKWQRWVPIRRSDKTAGLEQFLKSRTSKMRWQGHYYYFCKLESIRL